MRTRRLFWSAMAVVGLGALALLTSPKPAMAEVPAPCSLCIQDCANCSGQIGQLCGAHCLIGWCTYTGACQGESGHWWPAQCDCLF